MEPVFSPPLSSRLPPVRPGAATPTTSLPSPLTPSPTATPPPVAPHSPASLSPAASGTPPCIPIGRGKSQRWCRDTPPTGKSGGGAATPSFKDVLLGGTAGPVAAPAPAIAASPTPAAASPVVIRPRITVLPVVNRPQVSSEGPDAEGWFTALSRRTRKENRWLERRPRRSVPVDLRGRCFNCFSTRHRAASCRSRSRCFRCREMGHLSYACRRTASSSIPTTKLVWRPTTSTTATVPPVVNMAASQSVPFPAPSSNTNKGPGSDSDGDGVLRHPRRVSACNPGWKRSVPVREPADAAAAPRSSPQAVVLGSLGSDAGSAQGLAPGSDSEGVRRRRRRPRNRQRRNGGHTQPSPAAPTPAEDVPASSSETIGSAEPPPCIINWSGQVARAEEDLSQAVIVTVIGSALAVDVVAEIASRINVEADSLVLRSTSGSTYLLVLPNMDMVELLVGQRQPLRSATFSFSLLCKKWNRLAGAAGRVLPCLVDMELQGIPAHVWETSTVAQFLNPYAWIQDVHPDTHNLADLSSFRCSAWCHDPAAIPQSRELWVAEPPIAVVEDPPVKRALAYPINIRFQPFIQHHGSDPSSPSSEDGNGDLPARQRRRFRSRSPPPDSRPAGSGAGGSAGPVRRPVRERVGPMAPIDANDSLKALSGSATGIQEDLDDVREDQSDEAGLGLGPLVENSNSFSLIEGERLAPTNVSVDLDMTPSVASPTLVRFGAFEVDVAAFQPIQLDLGLEEPADQTVNPAQKEKGNMDSLEATVGLPQFPASPIPPTPSSIPDFDQLKSPPVHDPPMNNAGITPLKVYSRCHSRLARSQGRSLQSLLTANEEPAAGVAVPSVTPPTAGISPPTDGCPTEGVAVSSETPPAAGIFPSPDATPPAAGIIPSPDATTEVGVAVPSATLPAAGIFPPAGDTPVVDVAISSATPPAAGVAPLPDSTPTVGVAVPSMTPPAAGAAPPTDPRQAFISKLTQHTSSLLPVPAISNRRSKLLLGETPRCSHHLAGADVEFQPDDYTGRSKKKAMRALKIIEEREGINQQAQDDYAKLFGHPLPDEHLKALAMLFNWSLPDGFDQEDEETVLL
ncbi:unnamed protein product [Urochloa humidicola]